MIDLKIDNGIVKRLGLMGTTNTITADVIGTISVVYASLYKNDKDCARAFKKIVEAAIKDGLPWSIAKGIKLDDDDDDEKDEDDKKDEDDIKKMLSMLDKIINKGKKE